MTEKVLYADEVDYSDEFLHAPQYQMSIEYPISSSSITLSNTTGSTATWRIGGNGSVINLYYTVLQLLFTPTAAGGGLFNWVTCICPISSMFV